MQSTNSMPATTLGFLDECHNIVLKHLRAHIKKMYENSDTAFLEFAEKAQSSASQLRFFEAMSVIQKNRENVESTFYQELGRSFADFGCTGTQEDLTHGDANISMELVSKDDTDIQVAIQNMTASASLGSSQELVALRQRLAILNHGRQMEEKDIPGGPSCLANAFHLAAKDLVLEHQTLLIVYMLFNKFVLSKTTLLYDEYNKHLLKAGLLPNLKYQVRINPEKAQVKTQGQVAGETESAGNESSNQSLGDELFGNIMQLLARRDDQGQDNSRESHAQSGSSINNPLPQAELVSALHKLQQDNHADTPAVTVNSFDASDVRGKEQLVANLVAGLSADRDRLFDGIDRRRLPTADTQVIDLVGMMFEYMLNDDEIPNVAKAELSRLHTPYLKVAIIDKGLFTNTRHPAHELLNTLAKASARWVFEENLERGIFPSIHNVVERTLAEFENNIDIFSDLLELFRASVQDMEIKSAAIEKRTRQAAEGKEKLGVARKHAAAAIRSCTDGHAIPAPVKKLLNDVWQEKLMFIYLREPGAAESDSWHLAMQTVEAIIWSVEPRSSSEAQTELRERLPEVQKYIELAFDTLDAYGSSNNESQLALIRDIQEAILNAPIDESACKETQADTPEPATSHDETFSNDESSIEATADELSTEEQAALDELHNIPFGTWFSIQENENSLPVHVKLSWYSKMSGNYMFVNSMGMRVIVRKQTELATMMATGRASIIQDEQHPLVHRALEAIRRMLGGEQKAFA
ncbi:MAG: DUF1631 domain-containing protein [Gammaproteobacteria bacterium]|nr:DUF1631 domain-containing protein [Gammaproteobacteria bacterium]